MDKTFVVSFISFFENELTSEIIKAKTFQEAIGQHTQIVEYEFDNSKSLEGIKQDFFEQDAAVEVVEIG